MTEARQRRERLTAMFDEHRLEALLVTFLPNVRYLTGFTGSNGIVVVMPEAACFYTDPRYAIQAAGQVDCKVTVATGQLLLAAVKLFKRKRVRRIGIDKGRFTMAEYELFNDNLNLGNGLEPVSGLVERLRMVKSDAEVDAIRRSVLTNSKAFEQAVGRAKVGMTETDLAAELEYRMRRAGAEKTAFDSIVAGGVRSALPHASPGEAKLEDLVVVDMGALQDGYCSDMTRMLHVGIPSPKVKKLYRAVLQAQLAALDAVKHGVRTAAVDRAAREVLKGYGFEKAFVHSTGHGLGLEIHEAPRIAKKDKTRLEEGMAITIEPGAYLEGFGGVRIEDTVIVRRNGCEILTPTSKELRIV